ncbi:phosphodiesterase [Helicobacter jaachi]|uniref:Phosphodiesterase n=1 Tax=Helicobacter jaachi TaxID=1677920 RepID=A0A4U8TD39_9HELI|nr:phosphodiesterase [Helicobacter jaachi]TLD97188.1 phosphodiesterase [Helicobacter jaachi]
MKLIHITDTHYGKPKEAIYSREPAANMRKIIAEVNALHADAKLCFITGDLAHYGDLEAYRYLKHDLDTLEIPYYLILGNHDRRGAFREIFTHAPYTIDPLANGFMQYAFEIDTESNKSVFLMLDTLNEGSDSGVYCEIRQAWLKEQLHKYHAHNVYICMHHAPFNTGIKSMDKIGLDPSHAKALYEILNEHKNIRHLFFGHYHSDITGKWGDISFSTLRGVSHQVLLDFECEEIRLDFKNAQYGVVFIDENPHTPLIVNHFLELQNPSLEIFS